MEHKGAININTRDRLLRAWQNSMELVRDFEAYSKEIGDDENAAGIFAEFAEDESFHAAKLLELLHSYEERGASCRKGE